ncbi:MAG: diguanylate cyclase [Pseudomonadota bacterium]
MITHATLLVADDERQNRTVLTELLQDDYRIVLAKNGIQALERARENAPDLILLDVLMPEMDGLETIRALKDDAATRDIPVIFISALDSPADEERGLELGAVDYIAKPFHPAIVRVRVRNHLQAVRQRRLLEQLALRDGLTEIPNRRRFEEVYVQEWRRCLRAGSPLSLLVADIDHFKLFNDSRGHAAGDEVLKRIARTIQATLRRAGDFAARYGGEEFAILLPGAVAEGAKAIAEQIREQVERLAIPHAESPVAPYVTISIGGATLVPAIADPPPDFFCSADSHLYDAKRAGRNKVIWG